MRVKKRTTSWTIEDETKRVDLAVSMSLSDDYPIKLAHSLSFSDESVVCFKAESLGPLIETLKEIQELLSL